MGSSHHGDDLPPRLSDAIRREFGKHSLPEMERMLRERESAIEELMTPNITLGKQHDFPQGAYGPTDEGAIGFAVGHDAENQKVVIDFQSPVTWLAMDPDQALHLVSLLVKHAAACKVANETERQG